MLNKVKEGEVKSFKSIRHATLSHGAEEPVLFTYDNVDKDINKKIKMNK